MVRYSENRGAKAIMPQSASLTQNMNITHLKAQVSDSARSAQSDRNLHLQIHSAKIDGTNARCCLDMGVAWPVGDGGRYPRESVWHSQRYDKSPRGRAATQVVQFVQQGASRRRHTLSAMARKGVTGAPTDWDSGQTGGARTRRAGYDPRCCTFRGSKRSQVLDLGVRKSWLSPKPKKGDKIRSAYFTPASSGARMWPNGLHHPCLLRGPACGQMGYITRAVPGVPKRGDKMAGVGPGEKGPSGGSLRGGP